MAIPCPSNNASGSGTFGKKFGIIFLVVSIVSFSLVHTSYAQTQSGLNEQVTISENFQSDPVAQDLLKKIEQTKKMIEELQQKEFEQNQAQENLEKMRNESIRQLEQDLDEWQRVWEKHSSKNAFDRFVSKKPTYVQGVFWDQFEFKEQKVNAGRDAMNKVLLNGGTVHEAKIAYNKAAATKKIELIEVNAQFNVKHNLADFAEQQIFNSTGQVHLSPAIKAKLAESYSDYKLLPSFVIANPGDSGLSFLQTDSDVNCGEGQAKVSLVTSNRYACIEESVAKKWIDSGANRIMIVDDNSDGTMQLSDVPINPATRCQDGFMVVYHIADSEYQCILDSTAQKMVNDNIGKIHTLEEYILNKDKKKVYDDEIFAVNQEINAAIEEHALKIKGLELQYDEILKNEELNAKQAMQEFVTQYKDGKIPKDDVNRIISEMRAAEDLNKQKILSEKSESLAKLELELKSILAKIVKGYENNPDIDIDWNYLNEKSLTSLVSMETAEPVESFTDQSGGLLLDNVKLVNSFGHELDEIRAGDVLQITADITNTHDSELDFAYVVQVSDDSDVVVEPAKWVTGTLNPDQTLNVGLSWISTEAGQFVANILAGENLDETSQITEIGIKVRSEGNLHDVDYCKNDYTLLFKYSDNSPICTKSDTASKLIKLGLAFD